MPLHTELSQGNTPWFPQGGHGAAPAMPAPSPLHQPAASLGKQGGEGSRHVLFWQICTNASTEFCHCLRRADAVEQLPSHIKDELYEHRATVPRVTLRFVSVVAVYMIWNDPLKFKLQIPFPTNFVSSPEEGAGGWTNKENGLNKRYLPPELAGLSLLLTKQLYWNK